MDPTGKIAKPHKTFVTVTLYRNYVCNHAYIQIYSRTHIYICFHVQHVMAFHHDQKPNSVVYQAVLIVLFSFKQKVAHIQP